MAKQKKESYLLLHQTGTLACTDTLDISVGGLAAIIDLKSLTVFIDGEWQEIPKGVETLEEADEFLEELEEEEETEDYVLRFPLGARRVISPEFIWKYCKM